MLFILLALLQIFTLPSKGLKGIFVYSPAPAISTVQLIGGRSDYNVTTGKFAYDKLEADGAFDIWMSNLDGSSNTCITCGFSGIKNRGNPEFTPDGQHIYYQEEDELAGCSHADSNPGLGNCNNLKIMEEDGSNPTLLVDVNTGVILHPKSHPTLDFVMWAQSDVVNVYAIKIAPINNIGTATPSLGTITTYAPGVNDSFYETNGWLKDNNTFIFSCTCDADDDDISDIDIATYNPTTTRFIKLTTSNNEWDEHPEPNLNGQLIWMSSKNNAEVLKTDFWIMNEDGTNPQRLTFFNDPTSSQFVSAGILSAGSSWVTGNKFIGDLFLTPVFDATISNFLFQFNII